MTSCCPIERRSSHRRRQSDEELNRGRGQRRINHMIILIQREISRRARVHVRDGAGDACPEYGEGRRGVEGDDHASGQVRLPNLFIRFRRVGRGKHWIFICQRAMPAAFVRPSWSHHSAVSGCGYNDQLFLRALDLNLQHLSLYSWTLVGVVLGPCVATWTHNADPLGHLGGFLNTCQTTLGHLRASMEPSWSHLGPHAVLLG